ncbi:MAG: amidohydrolase family protein [Proteobacteria bacterium]|nr:amidohydrolase family protein [Pseudomonadota bacterium]
MNPDPVIDVDGHVLMEAADGWLDYFDAAEAREMEELLLGNRGHWYARDGGDKAAAYRAIRERNKGEGGWDPRARLTDMDAEGIDVAVLFGTEMGLNRDAYSPGICRGYNNWLADYCAADPERLRGVALLPLEDVDAACRELERAVGELGFAGFFMKSSVNRRTADAAHYDPIYATAERLDVPLLLHIPHELRTFVHEQLGYSFLRSHVIHPFSEMLSVLDVIFGGLLDRFELLRIGFMEGQVGWLPWFVWRMQEQYEEYAPRPGMDPGLNKPPMEYLDEGRLFFSCDPEEKYLGFAAGTRLTPQTLGEDCILWASDYPHSDAIFPGALETFMRQPDLSADQKRKITSRNARALLYGGAPG